MGLEDIKNRLFEKEMRQLAKKQDEETKKQLEEQAQEERILLSTENDLPKLQMIEDFFWECAEKLSDIFNLPISRYDRKTFLGFPRSSIKTKDYFKRPQYPRLEAGLDYGENSLTFNDIHLEAREGVLYFDAIFGNRNPSSIKFGPSKSSGPLVRHTASFDMADFDLESAMTWLEEQFVAYYNKFPKQAGEVADEDGE